MLTGKTLLIFGGTGSFGNAVLERFLSSDLKEIRIFSRDEKKQDDLRKKYNNQKIKFYIGDVRDYRAVCDAVRGVNFIFHAAALKQVPSCEFFPLEAVKTNIIGTNNVLEASIQAGVEKVICLSTDKAVYPINAMGISKAMMEKVITSRSRNSGDTVIVATRYGNVMGSRGSVIPHFLNQIQSNTAITITDPLMTRFMMSLNNAMDLVMYALENGSGGDIFIQKAPACTIKTLAKSLIELMEKPEQHVNIIGRRHGEKLYESLLSKEEYEVAEDLGDYFRVPPDLRDLNYNEHCKSEKIECDGASEYHSHNTTRLEVEQMKSLLQKLPIMSRAMAGEPINI